MFLLNCSGRLLSIETPLVMGIINTTPDSFFSGSRKQQTDEVLRQAEKDPDQRPIVHVGG